MDSLILDEYRSLFRDDASFDQFVQDITTRFGQDFAPVISNQCVLGSLLSPEATRDILYERLSRRLSERPELLGEIKERIEKDEIVD